MLWSPCREAEAAQHKKRARWRGPWLEDTGDALALRLWARGVMDQPNGGTVAYGPAEVESNDGAQRQGIVGCAETRPLTPSGLDPIELDRKAFKCSKLLYASSFRPLRTALVRGTGGRVQVAYRTELAGAPKSAIVRRDLRSEPNQFVLILGEPIEAGSQRKEIAKLLAHKYLHLGDQPNSQIVYYSPNPNLEEAHKIRAEANSFAAVVLYPPHVVEGMRKIGYDEDDVLRSMDGVGGGDPHDLRQSVETLRRLAAAGLAP